MPQFDEIGISPTVKAITIAPGTEARVGDASYKLKKEIVLSYIDWQGAGAMLLIDDPLHPGQRTRFPPVLEGDQDIVSSAREVITGLAKGYDYLLHANLGDQSFLMREREGLAGLFEVSQAA